MNDFHCKCGKLLFKYSDCGNVEIKIGKQTSSIEGVKIIELNCTRCNRNIRKDLRNDTNNLHDSNR
jgi:hypothetical protein